MSQMEMEIKDGEMVIPEDVIPPYLAIFVWGGVFSNAKPFTDLDAAIAYTKSQCTGFHGSSDEACVVKFNKETNLYDIWEFNYDSNDNKEAAK